MAENPPRSTLPHRSHTKACRVQFSPSGVLLAVASDPNPRTYVIDPPEKPTRHKIFRGHAGHVTDLAFSSDSRFLATSSHDTTVRLWDVSSGSLVRTFIGHNYPVSCVKFNRDSDVIASGSSDETVRLWDVESGACKKVIPAFGGHITGIDFSPDGSMVVAGSLGGLCRIWETATTNRINTLEASDTPVGSVKFSSDGRSVLIGTLNSTLRVWSIDWRRWLNIIYVGHKNKNSIIDSTFLGAYDMNIVSGSEDNCIYICDAESGVIVEKIEEAHAAPVQSVSCHPTRPMIASGSLEDPNTVKVWSRPDYSFGSELQTHEQYWQESS